MPTTVGISTFMSRKNSILGLSEPEKAEFCDKFELQWLEHLWDHNQSAAGAEGLGIIRGKKSGRN